MSDYFMETQAHEWILSSGTGAYALGTGNLINQRKYNGLLIRSDADFGRILLVSGIEEEIEWRGEAMFLDSSHYNNCIYPEGFLHLVKSWLRPFPVFLYSSLPHNEDILIKKEILMDETTSTVLIKYTNLCKNTLKFRLRPKFALRNHHYLNEAGTWDRVVADTTITSAGYLVDINFGFKRLDNKAAVFGYMQHGFGFEEQRVYSNVYYPWEASRGFPSVEDLIAPFGLEFNLKVNESNYILFSDTTIDNPNEMIENIEKRYRKLPVPADIPQKRAKTIGSKEEVSLLSKIDFDDNMMFSRDEYLKILEFSLKDFLANNDIVAGFPWFGAWGRDSMISMEGVMKLPKGAEIAYGILMKYSEKIADGLIPNMCGESHQQGNYMSIDATLWFLLRLFEVSELLVSAPKSTKKSTVDRWKKAITIAENVLEEMLTKTHENYFMRTDGLIELKESFANATWMDAKVNNQPVTPRSGAPVEINALLYNAIRAYEVMIERHNELCSEKSYYHKNQVFLEAAACLQQSFGKFWIEGYLADRIVGDEPLREIRPNAIIATSLPFTSELLSIDLLRQIYDTAHVELFTTYGLRTLSPKDSRFKKKYFGGVNERDRAYHQGTTWAFLLLPLAKTWLIAFADKSSEEAINHLAYLVDKLRNGYQKGHIASVAEVWDGDKPHFPKGCPAQAWSVSSLYSIECLIEELQRRNS
ncbi:MAG: amylo-alpha-1,6-glucosidase [Candidatus Cloacimonetes bacterium]|nr:amylo-alpha-1,6-glucosidase [Candidatus Cloacimonadota bacterium]